MRYAVTIRSRDMSPLEPDERFAELLQAHHTQLFGYLYALVQDVNDAEDLFQETSLVLWSKFAEYQEGTNFFRWAKATARYKMLNFLRSQERRRQFSAELHARLSNVFDELDARHLQARLEVLQDCKEKLSEDDRQLLEACYGSELSWRETAGQLGKSPKSVYNAMGRIRSLLMKCIEDRLARKERGL